MTVQDLVNHNVIAGNDPGLIPINRSKTIQLPNRVPNKWNLTAESEYKLSQGSADFPLYPLTDKQEKAFNSNNDLSTPLSAYDFLVSSPNLQNVNGKLMIGRNSELKLFGMQGDTDTANNNSGRTLALPTISAPIYLPPPIFTTPLNLNQELYKNLGNFSLDTIKIFSSIPGVKKTHVDKMSQLVKRRFKTIASKDENSSTRPLKKRKIFEDHDNFVSFLIRDIRNTELQKALKLDSSIEYK